MKHLILFCTITLLMLHAPAQTARKTRIIKTSISKEGITSGDTTFYSYNINGGGTLLRFFQKNIRMPWVASTYELDMGVGSCNLYLIIDTAGKVTKSWCDSVTNNVVEKEVLRVAGKLAFMKPTTIKGKPVITRVIITVSMEHANDGGKYSKADLLVVGYDPAHKKSSARALPLQNLVKKQ